jgi:hypothetical protein
VKPARHIIPAEPLELEAVTDMPKHALYAEVLGTAYSMGGDGFVLHIGDIVLILQFLAEYGLAEVRWKGLQGLFSVDRLKVMAPPPAASENSSRLWELTRREVSSLAKVPLARSKVLMRLQERQRSEKTYAK